MWDFSLSLKMAIGLFPLVAALLTLPYAVVQYHRYGAQNFWRILVIYSFFFYLLVALLLVVVPLPDKIQLAKMATPTPQLKLFHFLDSFRNHGLRTGGFSAWQAFVLTPVFQQVFFNLLLTIPFGIYLRYYFRKRWFTTLVLTGCLSLFFELTQKTGLWWLYPKAYRLFDVDDILLNTLGGLVGFLITPMVVFLFPTRESMDQETIRHAERISLIRRAVASIIDLSVLTILALFVGNLLYPNAPLRAMLIHPVQLIKRSLNHPGFVLLTILMGTVMMTVISYIGQGDTLGKYLVRISLAQKDQHHLSFWRLWLRYLVLGIEASFLYFGLMLWKHPLASLSETNLNGSMLGMMLLILMIVLFMVDGLFAWMFHMPLLHERISKIGNLPVSYQDNSE